MKYIFLSILFSAAVLTGDHQYQVFLIAFYFVSFNSMKIHPSQNSKYIFTTKNLLFVMIFNEKHNNNKLNKQIINLKLNS